MAFSRFNWEERPYPVDSVRSAYIRTSKFHVSYSLADSTGRIRFLVLRFPGTLGEQACKIFSGIRSSDLDRGSPLTLTLVSWAQFGPFVPIPFIRLDVCTSAHAVLLFRTV